MQKALLLIYGDQELMSLTKRILERVGFSVHGVTGLAGARGYFADIKPDLVIIGNDLPDGNGLDYCRELRQGSGVPILFVSGNRDDELPALQARANDFIKKPYIFDIMLARINIVLNGAITHLN